MVKSNQMSLFRTEEPNDKAQFEKASRIKKALQDEIKTIISKDYIAISESKNVAYFSTKAETLLGEESSYGDPQKNPRVTIRRFKSALTLIKGEGNSKLISESCLISDPWASIIYSDLNQDTYWFYELSRKICNLRFAADQIALKAIEKEEERLNEQIEYIIVDHLLDYGGEKTKENESPNLTMEKYNKIALMESIEKYVLDSQKTLLGVSLYYKNRDLIDEINIIKNSNKYNVFGNDYIFLNNIEFPWERDSLYSIEWPDVVYQFDHLYKEMKSNGNKSYFYFVPIKGGLFARVEILKNKIKKDDLINAGEWFKNYFYSKIMGKRN